MKSTDNKDFKIYDKEAYSHGFEAIYTLQNVDLKTVRKVSFDQPQKQQNAARVSKKKPPSELFLDLGIAQSEVIQSFYLDEPISVLALSLQAERRLFESDVKSLRDLLAFKDKGLSQVKGLGQGHIDEIIKKLEAYLEGKDLYETDRVDFLSLLRSLLGGLDGKKLCSILQPFGLAEQFAISPADRMSVKHQYLQRKQDNYQEAVNEARTKDRLTLLKAALEKVVAAFIKPWMRRRQGIATNEEISERIQSKSAQEQHFYSAFQLIQDVYFDHEFPFASFLFPVEECVWAIDAETAQLYNTIIETAKTYFYALNLSYPFHDLVTYISKESARKWQAIDPLFVEKVLKTSSLFSIKRIQENQLSIFIL